MPALPGFLRRFRRGAGPTAIESTGALFLCTDDPELQTDVTAACPSDLALRVVADARQAWELMRSETPGAVIVDLQTGSAGGFALARDMSQLSRLVNVPIVMLLERTQDEWLAREAGAARSVTKPVNVPNLVAEVLELIEQGRAA